MMWWYGNGMGGAGYLLMTVGNVLLWALLVLGVVALLRHGRSAAATRSRPTAQELLAERFARGEITDQEYRAGLGVLHEGLRAGTER